jgi:hypothetical protein
MNRSAKKRVPENYSCLKISFYLVKSNEIGKLKIKPSS